MIASLQFLITYTVPFLIIISLVITVHELGHFWAARAFGVVIDRFSLGFGRPIFARTDKHGVEWRIGWIPLGGYVRFSGDSNDASLPDGEELENLRRQIHERFGAGAEKRFYHFKPVWQRAIIAAAGPAANFLLAITIFTTLFVSFGDYKVLPRIGHVEAGSPAEVAGFRAGDLVKTADGRPIKDFEEIMMLVRLHSGETIRFEVDRGGQTVVILATPVRSLLKDDITGTEAKLGRLGFSSSRDPADVVQVRYNLVTALSAAIDRVGDSIAGTLKYLGRVVTGRESGDQIGGVIGMAQASGSVAKSVVNADQALSAKLANLAIQMVWIAGYISVGIGFVNLLPIPILDGGHLLFYGYEALARRPVGARVQEASYRVGLALVLGLMLFATWNDLQRLRAFQFLGGLFS